MLTSKGRQGPGAVSGALVLFSLLPCMLVAGLAMYRHRAQKLRGAPGPGSGSP